MATFNQAYTSKTRPEASKVMPARAPAVGSKVYTEVHVASKTRVPTRTIGGGSAPALSTSGARTVAGSRTVGVHSTQTRAPMATTLLPPITPVQLVTGTKVIPTKVISPVQEVATINPAVMSAMKVQYAAQPAPSLIFPTSAAASDAEDELIEASFDTSPPTELVEVEPSAGPLGLSTTTWLLIGGGLVAAYFLMKK